MHGTMAAKTRWRRLNVQCEAGGRWCDLSGLHTIGKTAHNWRALVALKSGSGGSVFRSDGLLFQTIFGYAFQPFSIR